MKKISILLAGLAFTIGFGQVDSFSRAIDQTIIASEGTNAACSFVVEEDVYWGGNMSTSKYASHFLVDESTVFQPEELSLVIAVFEDDTYSLDGKEFILNIYEDDGFVPGSSISSATVTPTLSTFRETVTFTSGATAHLYDVVFDVSSMPAANIENLDNWFGIEMASDDGIQVGLNFTLSAAGSVTYYNDGTGWNLFNSSAPDNISFTYNLTGDCSTMGVNDLDATSLAVYPNPATDVVKATVQNTEVTSMTVINMNGQVVATSKSSNVNVSALPAGVYVVKVTDTKGSVHTSKIVKK